MCVPAEQEKIVGVVPAEKASCAPVRPAGAEKLLWRLHGAEYDFEPFVKSHPGGEIAIRLGQGIDATLLFASYHAVGKGRAWATLECFRVGAKLPEPPAPSPFRDDVEKMLESHFNSAEPRRVSKASASHIALMALFGVLQLVGWVAWARGELLGLLLLPVFHWLFAVNVSHDATHFACSKSPLLNSLLSYTSLPYFYSPVTWYAQHVVMHHTHANEVNSDPDLQHFQPMKIHTLDTRVHKNETHTLLDYVKLLGTGLHLSLQIPVAASGVTTASYAKWYKEMYVPAVFIPPGLAAIRDFRMLSLLGPAAFVFALFYPYWAVQGTFLYRSAFAFIPPTACSAIFAVITQVSHVQPEAQTHALAIEPDFLKRQALTSVDYCADSRLWGVLTGGLNVQSLHHLVPCVHSSHYAALYPQFRVICDRHGVKLAERRGLLHAARTALSHVWRLNHSKRMQLMKELL